MASLPDSRLTYAPILLGVAFVATLFIVAESGYKRLHEAGLAISAAEERQALLSRYLRARARCRVRAARIPADRGQAIPPHLRSGGARARSDGRSHRQALRESGFEADAEKAEELRTAAGRKVGEMQTALRLYGEVDRAAALQLVDTDIGQRAMNDLRHQLRDLYDPEERAPGGGSRKLGEGPADVARAARGRELPLARARGHDRGVAWPRHAPARRGDGAAR